MNESTFCIILKSESLGLTKLAHDIQKTLVMIIGYQISKIDNERL
jgi:hypothetical protein